MVTVTFKFVGEPKEYVEIFDNRDEIVATLHLRYLDKFVAIKEIAEIRNY